jgi:hypothetical protein
MNLFDWDLAPQIFASICVSNSDRKKPQAVSPARSPESAGQSDEDGRKSSDE